MKTSKELQEIINHETSKILKNEDPINLYEPITYILSLGGKRLRPILTLMAYQLGKSDPEKVAVPALSVEVFHNFTLMHDDIMDEAPLRRGKPTVHEKWNQTIAILSGDAMLVKAYELLQEVDVQYLPNSLKRFNQVALEVCEGQQLDMDFEQLDTVSEQDYLEMIRRKTAVLIGFSLELGGIMAGFDKEHQSALYQIGENMGLGFQLMDDLLDVYGEQAKFGKQIGGDIIANKKTYLMINALELASPEKKEHLNEWIAKEVFENDEKVNAVKAIYNDLGIVNITKMKIDYYFNKAFEILDHLEANHEAKIILNKFALQLTSRDK